MTKLSYSEANARFKYLNHLAVKEVKSRRAKGLESHAPSLISLDDRLTGLSSEKPTCHKYIGANKIIGLVSDNRKTNYSWSFYPLPEDDSFKNNWLTKASNSDFFDSGKVSLIPIGNFYFALNMNLNGKSKLNQSNSHYYASIAKAFNMGVRASIYDIISKEIQEDILMNHPEILVHKNISSYSNNKLINIFHKYVMRN